MNERRFGVIEFSLGLLSGVVLGVGLGLLLAPQSGSQTRVSLANRATGIKSTASDLLDQAKLSIEVAATQVEKVTGLQERSLRRKLNEIKDQLDKYHLNEV